MSTKLTTSVVEPPLGQLMINAQQWISIGLMHAMQKRGFTGLSATHLQFLSNLDCGLTHASAVARAMGVSRQAVYRITRELEKMDILRLQDDPERGNQKLIIMTDKGNQVAIAAREGLAEIEKILEQRIGEQDFAAMTRILSKQWGDAL